MVKAERFTNSTDYILCTYFAICYNKKIQAPKFIINSVKMVSEKVLMSCND